MAFHVACPITCQRICFCPLGFPEALRSEDGKKGFLEEVHRLEELLMDPWSLRAGGRRTVHVLVPKLDASAGRKTPLPDHGIIEHGVTLPVREDAPSLQLKRAMMQRKAVEESLAAEDYARRLETGQFTNASGEVIRDPVGECQNPKIICRLCFSGEDEGSDRAARMLPCGVCNKKYHKNCLKNWARHRDLFDWNSWVCPSCRICEVCKKSGDPTKFMFCKRCDGAYHSYCQHHPHKNVSSGPYLCPKHTRCHSCASTVPGNGASTRWFLSYTCCDACGRLFVRGNYCPICLKVYRDSESTPMVCCDVCQHWVHAQCDGISDEKYQKFQVDSDLHYKCGACRGECYKVKDLDDAVQELWRRRDNADRAVISSLRTAAGLTEEYISISPYSDDEECHVKTVSKSDGKLLKFSVKGLSNSTDQVKEYSKNVKPSKKHTKKKDIQTHSESNGGGPYPNEISEHLFEVQKLEDGMEYKCVDYARTEKMVFFQPPGSTSDIAINQVDIANEEKPHENHSAKVTKIRHPNCEEVDQKFAMKTEANKGKRKLVIHLGSRNKNSIDIPKLETSSGHREQDPATSMGSEEIIQKVHNSHDKPPELPAQTVRLDNKKGARRDATSPKLLIHRSKEDSLFKEKTSNHDVGGEKGTKNCESRPITMITYEKRNLMENKPLASYYESTIKKDVLIPLRQSRVADAGGYSESVASPAPMVSSKPLLKLKFKTLSLENHSSWVSKGADEKNFIKGQRSKRKRPSPMVDKKLTIEGQDTYGLTYQGNSMDQETDARILKKLGKGAIGKRVEVNQASDDSWHRGVMTGSVQGHSALSVSLDDGRDAILEFNKQRVRFVLSQSQIAKKMTTIVCHPTSPPLHSHRDQGEHINFLL